MGHAVQKNCKIEKAEYMEAIISLLYLNNNFRDQSHLSRDQRVASWWKQKVIARVSSLFRERLAEESPTPQHAWTESEKDRRMLHNLQVSEKSRFVYVLFCPERFQSRAGGMQNCPF